MKTVFVGLSGGVDSSVSALLLLQQGYRVEGVFMKNWSQESEQCSLKHDLGDAQQVAESLKIPLHIVDFSAQYWDAVFEEFLAEIERGRTPNPDIWCNQHIKFDVFYKWCRDQGADLIATGHYASLTPDARLACAHDQSKDQTYFLWAVDPNVFQHVIFPLGSYPKSQVREIAKEHHLITHDKSDSTGICFIGPKNFRTFLAQYIVHTPGNIITTRGDIVGKHQGLGLYTLGQRSGLNLGGCAGYDEAPWYVVDKKYTTHELVVSQDHADPLLLKNSLSASSIVWQHPLSQQTFRAKARIRHLQQLQECTVQTHDDKVEVHFDHPQRAITAGQSIVFYQDNLCLGGGIIDKSY